MKKSKTRFEYRGVWPFGKRWFVDSLECDQGRAFMLEVSRIRYGPVRSKYQEICVFETPSHGTVLTLDGTIQCTGKDESRYQEAIAHVPLCLIERPKRVAVIGGGDGGVIREVLKHKSVEQTYLAEIDETVVEVSKKYLHGMAFCLNDPRANVKIVPGEKFIKSMPEKSLDAIIVDMSDPGEGMPAGPLYREEFMRDAKRALTPEGILCIQGESTEYHLPLVLSVRKRLLPEFSHVRYFTTMVTSYPGGSIGFHIASNKAGFNPEVPIAERVREVEENCAFYSERAHEGMFKIVPSNVMREFERQLEEYRANLD